MQLFLDTTDTAVLKDLAATGLVDGVTTNPSLIAKSGRPMLEVIAEICDLVEGPVSAEVAATDVEGMLAEGRKLAAVATNVVVKAPLTRAGLIATAEFAREGIQTNVTLCFSAAQALIGRPKIEIPVPLHPELQRVACTTCAVTLDFNPRRLNIFFDAQTGIIKEARCG